MQVSSLTAIAVSVQGTEAVIATPVAKTHWMLLAGGDAMVQTLQLDDPPTLWRALAYALVLNVGSLPLGAVWDGICKRLMPTRGISRSRASGCSEPSILSAARGGALDHHGRPVSGGVAGPRRARGPRGPLGHLRVHRDRRDQRGTVLPWRPARRSGWAAHRWSRSWAGRCCGSCSTTSVSCRTKPSATSSTRGCGSAGRDPSRSPSTSPRTACCTQVSVPVAGWSPVAPRSDPAPRRERGFVVLVRMATIR